MSAILSTLRHLLRPLQLMLPVLVPSWRFFDAVAPSPRVQYRLLSDSSANNGSTIHPDNLTNNSHHCQHDWREFRPRAAHLSLATLCKRLLWNATWNEQLFITSCAERLLEQPTQHSEREIAERITRQVHNELTQPCHQQFSHMQFRLMVIARDGDALHSSEQFRSALHPFITTTTP